MVGTFDEVVANGVVVVVVVVTDVAASVVALWEAELAVEPRPDSSDMGGGDEDPDMTTTTMTGVDC